MRTTRHDLLTRAEASVELRISLSTLTRLYAAGEIRTVRVGRTVLIPVEEIERIKAGKPAVPANDDPMAAPDGSTYPPTPSMIVEDPNALPDEPATD